MTGPELDADEPLEDEFEDDDLPPYLRDVVDPELEQLRPQINYLRPIMALVIIAGAVYGLTLFRTQVEYFFSDTEPIELGEIADYPSLIAENPDSPPEIPHNRYVRLTGIPTRFSAICAPPVRYFKVVGAHIYVDYPMEEELSAIACHAETKKRNVKIPDLDYFEGAGRAVAFARSGREYTNLKTFYEREYRDLFCSSMTEGKKAARLKELRTMLRETFKAQKGAYPDGPELEKMLARETLCHNAYMIQSGVSPRSYWHFLLIYAVLFGIIIWNLYTLGSWARKAMPR